MENSVLSPVITKFGIASSSSASANEANSSGVSWAAVIGGAVVTAALSLVLLSLGTGLGLASISPWENTGASATTIRAAAILWLILMQLLASAMGGYLAGRLRTKWASIHTDEVFFRDTAHGFLSWAVAVVITGAFLASAASSMAGGALRTGPAAGVTVVTNGSAGQTSSIGIDPNAYFVDMLFRTERPLTDGDDAPIRAEAGRIFANALRQDNVSPVDKTYLGQIVSARTSLPAVDADKRVDDTLTQARNAALKTQQAVDMARKTASHLSLWIFIALLVGAFSASVSATIGGRQRDNVVII